MCSSRIVYSYWMLCYVVMYFWVFLAWVGPNNLICLNLSFLFITQLLRNTSLFLSALLISFILCLLEEYLSYISYTTLVLVTLSTLSISELLGWVPPPLSPTPLRFRFMIEKELAFRLVACRIFGGPRNFLLVAVVATIQTTNSNSSAAQLSSTQLNTAELSDNQATIYSLY